MRLNFFRRVRILPGLWLNLSKGGMSTTVGVRGLKATFGRNGDRVTAGLPGTGLSVTETLGAGRVEAADDEGQALLDKALLGKGRSHR